jgi:FixJ family two-component response regulator
LEFQRQLAEMGVTIPIIFITGHADVHTSVRAMKAGAVDFLPKPFRDQELLDAVMKAVEGEASRRKQDREMADLRACAEQLSPREIEVLRAVQRGLLNKQIAFELGIAEITAKMHRSNASKKLKATSIADLVRKIEALKL